MIFRTAELFVDQITIIKLEVPLNKNKFGYASTAVLLSTSLLAGCGGGNGGSDNQENPGGEAETARVHDSRTFSVPPVETLDFDDIDVRLMAPATHKYYGHYEGIQGPAAYAAEFPVEGWNGGVVMYTHGYGGEGEELGGQVPNDAFRAAVIGAGYAWAGSSYSANFYDVRAAIEDTNKLALELKDYLADDWSADPGTVDQILISGYSLGGHTAAAAVDRENLDRTQYKVDYAGAMPFCQAEQNQFQWLGDYTRAAQQLAGFGETSYESYPRDQIIGALFDIQVVDADTGATRWTPATPNAEHLRDLAMQLTGGERPIFKEHGFTQGRWQGAVFSTGGSDGTINGILSKDIYDNIGRTYRWTTGSDATAPEQAFNDAIDRAAADEGVNPLREDGVRWLPLVKGDFQVPVMTLHTLGDFYVPFRHQQLYREGAIENNNEDLLVQRAIRAPGHCDFTPREVITGMTEFFLWVNGGPKPLGDNEAILDPELLAADDFGCDFSDPGRDAVLVGACTTAD